MRMHEYLASLLMLALPLAAVGQTTQSSDFDVLIKGGTVYDGTGRAPRRVDVGIKADRIVAIGNLRTARARNIVNAEGLAVAPGFINMLSWSTESLTDVPRARSGRVSLRKSWVKVGLWVHSTSGSRSK
jgi:N-acyl-D-amino-acid deacylase